MAKGIPTTEEKKAEIIRTWKEGALTYQEVCFCCSVPISTVRLIIDNHIKEKLKPLKVKLSRGIQLTFGI